MRHDDLQNDDLHAHAQFHHEIIDDSSNKTLAGFPFTPPLHLSQAKNLGWNPQCIRFSFFTLL